MIASLQKKYKSNKQWLYFSLMATFLWGMVAHAYGFVQNSFSHDSLKEFNGGVFGNIWKVQLGRFVVPVYRAIFRTDLTLPWLIGVLALLWIGLAVFFVIKLFRIDSIAIAFMAAGVFTTNITVSATAATYLHDFDCDMFALLCAVVATYLWSNVYRGEIIGVFFTTVVLGIYQSYISVTITLAMIICILDLLNGRNFKYVFIKGMRAITMLLAGGGLYYVALNIALRLANTSLMTGDYNSLTVMLKLTPHALVALILDVYKVFYQRLMNIISVYPSSLIKVITAVIIAIMLVTIIVGLLSKGITVLGKVLCICLIALLPVGMNLSHILSMGASHDLMVYAIWIFYLMALLMADWLVKYIMTRLVENGKTWNRFLAAPNYLCILMVFILMYSNVQVANCLYLKKAQEQDASLSLMTRIVYKLEDSDEYIPGETQVAFVGLSDQMLEAIPGFEKYYSVTGQWSINVLNAIEKKEYQAYFDYILASSIKLAGEETWNAIRIDSRVEDMPCYPTDGCVKMIDNVLVVKLGETQE